MVWNWRFSPFLLSVGYFAVVGFTFWLFGSVPFFVGRKKGNRPLSFFGSALGANHIFVFLWVDQGPAPALMFWFRPFGAGAPSAQRPAQRRLPRASRRASREAAAWGRWTTTRCSCCRASTTPPPRRTRWICGSRIALGFRARFGVRFRGRAPGRKFRKSPFFFPPFFFFFFFSKKNSNVAQELFHSFQGIDSFQM